MCEPLGRPTGPLNGLDGPADLSRMILLFNDPFGRPPFFFTVMEPSDRSGCSFEVAWPTGAILKDGNILSPARGLPRGFLGGKSLSFSSSSKKSWFSNRSSSAGETWSSILAMGTSSASGVITPSIWVPTTKEILPSTSRNRDLTNLRDVSFWPAAPFGTVLRTCGGAL